MQTSRERTKFKPDRSKTELINYRLDKIRGLIASLEWFIFKSFPNLKFFWEGEYFAFPSRRTHEAKFVFIILHITPILEFLRLFNHFQDPCFIYLLSSRCCFSTLALERLRMKFDFGNHFFFNRRTRMWKGGKKVTPLHWWQLNCIFVS